MTGGKVYIASMNMRGEWASVPDEIDDNHIICYLIYQIYSIYYKINLQFIIV